MVYLKNGVQSEYLTPEQ